MDYLPLTCTPYGTIDMDSKQNRTTHEGRRVLRISHEWASARCLHGKIKMLSISNSEDTLFLLQSDANEMQMIAGVAKPTLSKYVTLQNLLCSVESTRIT